MAGQGLSDLHMMLLDEDGNPIVGESYDSMFPGSKGFMVIEKFEFNGPEAEGGAGKEFASTDGDDTEDDDSEEDAEREKDKAKEKKKKKKGKKKKKKDAAPTKCFQFKVDKEYDKSSPILLQHYCKNLSRKPKPFQKAAVYCRILSSKSNSKLIYLKMTFEDVWIIKYGLDVQGSDMGSIPEEKIEFVFTRATFEYTPQSHHGQKDQAAGPITKGFDFMKKKPI